MTVEKYFEKKYGPIGPKRMAEGGGVSEPKSEKLSFDSSMAYKKGGHMKKHAEGGHNLAPMEGRMAYHHKKGGSLHHSPTKGHGRGHSRGG